MTQNRENLSSLKRSSQSSDKWVVVSLSSKRNSGDAHRECSKDTEHSMMLLMLLMSRDGRVVDELPMACLRTKVVTYIISLAFARRRLLDASALGSLAQGGKSKWSGP